MDVLAQASSVVEQAEATHGRVTLTLDLDEPAQRAAYAAALAVLQIHGLDPFTLTELGGTGRAGDVPPRPIPGHAPVRPAGESAAPERGARPGPAATSNEVGSTADSVDAAIRRSYAAALGELTTDAARVEQIVRETFPRVRELLRDGANVEAVAQIQHRRWTEEHLDTSRT